MSHPEIDLTPHALTNSRILVCDDSVFHATFLTRILAEQGYTQVTRLDDTRLVIPLLAKETFDLLLLDLKKPEVDGVALVREVRVRLSGAALPILLITVANSAPTRNAVLDEGANDYLYKPIDPLEMVLRVRNALSLREIYKTNVAIHRNLANVVTARTAKLNLLIDNGMLMALARDRTELFRHTLFEGRRLLDCDAASMYLVTPQDSLRFELRTRDDALPAQELALHDPVTGEPNEHYVATHAALHKKSILIADVYQETRFDLSGTRAFDQQTGYHTRSLLTVPMLTRSGDVIGVLQFINKLDPRSGAVVAFTPDLVSLVEALGAQAAVTLENLKLVGERQLFTESLIHAVAQAIDSRSRSLASHAERVPELATMLAREACAVRTGPLADFCFANEEEWHEFRIGAWLHDCGKITTPDHLLDKATKLETINNRIHEIRTRFEVLLRDARIEQLQSVLDGTPPDLAASRFEQRSAELTGDFAFVARCNLGQPALQPDDVLRLQRIGQTPWLRHFNDRLGLSREELARRSGHEAGPLPASEHLLQDSPHHLIERAPQPPGAPPGEPVPLYNLGELHNLCIEQGTLSAQERHQVNGHIVQGIAMLAQIPFPQSLRRVPEYALAHHELITGGTLAQPLVSRDLSVPARILVLAGLFESLTSSERPYRTPLSVSQAIEVLYAMKQAGEIDPDVFDLFLSANVATRYAARFLSVGQWDNVDISTYLGPVQN